MSKEVFTLLALLIVILLAGCTEPYQSRADGTQWQVIVTVHEYKRVQTGSIKVGDIDVPTYGNRWRTAERHSNEGTDNYPTEPAVDCIRTRPDSPNRGDQYCSSKTKYYLVFGEDVVSVDQTTWLRHEPNKLYTVKQTIAGLQLVKE